jgi:hypothetical protein
MSLPSPEIPSFRPRRKLVGYDRKATDGFVERVADLLEQAGKRADRAEAEIAQYREQERSLHEALMSVAKTADAIKEDARREAEAMREQAREFEELGVKARSQLSSFLHETLERLEGIPGEIETHYRVADPEKEEPFEASGTAEESSASAEVEAKGDDVEPPEDGGSILERLRPYRADASGSARSPGS